MEIPLSISGFNYPKDGCKTNDRLGAMSQQTYISLRSLTPRQTVKPTGRYNQPLSTIHRNHCGLSLIITFIIIGHSQALFTTIHHLLLTIISHSALQISTSIMVILPVTTTIKPFWIFLDQLGVKYSSWYQPSTRNNWGPPTRPVSGRLWFQPPQLFCEGNAVEGPRVLR